MKKTISFIHKFTLLLMSIMGAGLLFGCATGPDYAHDGQPDDGSRADPAAYVVEYFPVERPRERRPANDAQFYFKKCNETGEKWPYSRTSYDCDYPF